MPAPSRFPADFSVSAAYPLFDYDPQQDRGWILHFTPQDYRRASFLDERALGHRQVPGWTLDRSELPGLLPDSPTRPALHWLFHIGHCGSTLTSRLLDLVPGVLGLREPLPLLRLAGSPPAAQSPWFTPILRMLARRFPDTQAVIVKPTSVVTASARSLLDHSVGRACLLWVDLQTWLASVLRDTELRESILATEHSRRAQIPVARAAVAESERLARIWLAEQLRWRMLVAETDDAGRLIDLDFSTILRSPADAVSMLARHYGLAVPTDLAQRIESSGVLHRYAKDERHVFDAETRHSEIGEANRRHHDDIQRGLSWAEEALAANVHPELAARLRP